MAKTNNHILVTGAHGQLGFELQYWHGSFPDSTFVFTDKDKLDITDKDAVSAFFEKEQFTHCVNCAAYTAVDRAEEDSDLCRLINTTAVEYLVNSCRVHGVKFIHISTDYVYHSDQNIPFLETDPTSPKGVYAATKLAGDQIALSQYDQSIVIRTSWVYSSYGNNFVKTMIRLGGEKDELGVVSDQIGSPTYAKDLAKDTLNILNNENYQWSRGDLFHYSNNGSCSWYEFADKIFEKTNTYVKLKKLKTEDYPTKARRPKYSLLDKSKFENTFKIQIRDWKSSLVDMLKQELAL